MPLEERQLIEVNQSPSADVQRIIEMAAEEVERADQHCGVVRVPAFVPSDFQLIALLLAQLSREGLGDGTKFCEWGSGLGIVTMIADSLGWDAIGIEIDSELVVQSKRLAVRQGSAAEFHHGSFIPSGGEQFTDELDDLNWLHVTADDTYDRIGLEVGDFEVIYVYPWPGEVRLVHEIFDCYARPGAQLLSYHGADECHLLRKRR